MSKTSKLLDKSNELLESLKNNLIKETDLTTKVFIFERPFDAVKRTIKSSRELLQFFPEEQYAKDRIIRSLFISQRFKELSDYYSETPKSLIDISKKFSSCINKESGRLNEAHLAQLIKELRQYKIVDFYPLVESILAYDSSIRDHNVNYILPILEALKILNPLWDGSGLSYDFETKVLNICSAKLKVLKQNHPASGYSLLRFIPIDKLIISNSGISDLDHFESLQVNTLDLRDSKINSLEKLFKFKKLKEIYVRKGQFSKEDLTNLSNIVTIKTFQNK